MERALGQHLFFALRPPEGVARRIVVVAETLCRRHGLTGRPTPWERSHLSLYHVAAGARLPTSVVHRALEVGARVDAWAFTVALDRVVTLQTRTVKKPLVLWGEDGVLGVRALHARVHAAMLEGRLARGKAPPIEPHVTLLRDPADVAEAFLSPPVTWRATEFVLLHSDQIRARHTVLGRWPLREGAGTPN